MANNSTKSADLTPTLMASPPQSQAPTAARKESSKRTHNFTVGRAIKKQYH